MYNLYASLLGRPPCICERPMRLETSMRQKTDDTHVYTFDAENGKYRIFRITEIDREYTNLVSVIEIKIEDWEPLYMHPSFGYVGIFKIKGEHTEVEVLARSDIKGKVIVVGTSYVVTIPKIVLDEAV